MTPEEFQRHLNALADRLPGQLRGAVEATSREALARARWWSSGTLTQNDLNRLDHPYATRHGRPLLEPDRVNARSGMFLSGWAQQPTQESEGDVTGGVVNNSRVGEMYLHPGTKLMFARRPNEAAADETEPYFAAQVEAAVDELLG